MTTDKNKCNPPGTAMLPSINTLTTKPSVGIDVDYYQGIIDDPEVSEIRKRELIEIIGAILINFIDIGFGVHPVQLASQEKQSQQTNKEKLLERSDV